MWLYNILLEFSLPYSIWSLALMDILALITCAALSAFASFISLFYYHVINLIYYLSIWPDSTHEKVEKVASIPSYKKVSSLTTYPDYNNTYAKMHL